MSLVVLKFLKNYIVLDEITFMVVALKKLKFNKRKLLKKIKD